MDLGKYHHIGANISSFRIVDINSPKVDDATRDWERRLGGGFSLKFERKDLHVSRPFRML